MNKKDRLLFILLILFMMAVNNGVDTTSFFTYLVKQVVNIGVMGIFLIVLTKRAYRFAFRQ